MAVTKAANPGRKGKFKGFFKGIIAELKKVHWPNKKQIAVYTGVVLVTVLAASLVISLVDSIFSQIIKFFLG